MMAKCAVVGLIGLLLLRGAAFAAEENADVAGMVDRLLAMPTAAQDPRGLMNKERWALGAAIGGRGDAAIGPLLEGMKKAETELQRQELMTALCAVQTPAGTKELFGFVEDPRDEVRMAAVIGLAQRVGKPEGGEAVDLIVPKFVELVGKDKLAGCRIWMCGTLATAVTAKEGDPRAVEGALAEKVKGALRGRLADEEAGIRVKAASALALAGDNSGVAELKKAVLRLEANGEKDEPGTLEAVVPAIEKLTGENFGKVPMNPMLASDSRRVPALVAQRAEMVDRLAEWASQPATTVPSAQTAP